MTFPQWTRFDQISFRVIMDPEDFLAMMGNLAQEVAQEKMAHKDQWEILDFPDSTYHVLAVINRHNEKVH